MITVDQQVLHDPEKGLFGDCQRAVIASLLNLDPSDVPNFAQDSKNEPYEFWDGLQQFCRKHGYVYMSIPRSNFLFRYGDDGDVYHAISGKSPRSPAVNHVVVGKNGAVFHDPHPSRAGLLGGPADWEYAFLVKTSDN